MLNSAKYKNMTSLLICRDKFADHVLFDASPRFYDEVLSFAMRESFELSSVKAEVTRV